MSMKRVYKNKAYEALIDVLDKIYDDKPIKKIKNELLALEEGDEVDDARVHEIFGKWADPNPNPKYPGKGIKVVCAYLKKEMFR